MTEDFLADCYALQLNLSISAAPYANLSVPATRLQQQEERRSSARVRADLPVPSQNDPGEGKELKCEIPESKARS